jgi:hypothetical protein
MQRSILAAFGLVVSMAACSSGDAEGTDAVGSGAGGDAAGGGAGGASVGAGGGGGAASSGGDGATGGAGAGGAGLLVAGVITDWNGPGPTDQDLPLSGATVCVRTDSPDRCVTTDGSGRYELAGIAEGDDFGIRIQKAGYLTTLVLRKMPSVSLNALDIRVVSNGVAEAKCVAAGASCPLNGTGIVEVGINVESNGQWGPAEGATAMLTSPQGLAPVYLGLDGYPAPSLPAASAVGSAMFVNVPPGDAEITVTLPGKRCVIEYDGFQGSAPGTVVLPAEADTLTFMGVGCQ